MVKVMSIPRAHPKVWPCLFLNGVEQAGTMEWAQRAHAQRLSLVAVLGTLIVLIFLPLPSEEVLDPHESSEETSCGAQGPNICTRQASCLVSAIALF